MGPVNWLAVALGAVAFFAVGAIWYSLLFGKAWQRETGLTEEKLAGANMPMIFGLCFLLELVVAWMLGHLIARTNPQPHVIMMFALGFGAFLMAPAIGINYLYQRKSLKLWLIDAGHFVVGMAAMGGVFVALS
ncbi:DUF1761 domain-containing protein [Alteraurantiacibacter aquimixticola]|uniref:DUF1761 domain-containing protein n=1 Tax=Alteraurantiacibacter aquimixticola TaxID=2489173 RepID=A0A4V4U8T4_9SPHN|nr:DUF1761 domain-containing protein [Alteraurantiacibacter aquimixticola]TIX51217.1 DUF1761 domain-containing protein [Alteraurantiacibacter aquimixticola]